MLTQKVRKFQEMIEQCYLIKPDGSEWKYYNDLITKIIEDCCKLRMCIRDLTEEERKFLDATAKQEIPSREISAG